MFVYIMASRRNGTLYVGVTSNLVQRVWDHRHNIGSKFVARYKVYTLVYYEQHETSLAAITREKQIKKWYRKWKLELIEKTNWEWDDLYPTLVA